MNLTNKAINVIGDSITAGSGTSDIQNVYHAVLGRMVGARVVRNYGIGGTRVARFDCPEENWGPAFVDRYGDMADEADLILVFGGTNDYGHGVPLGTLADTTLETFCGAYRTLLVGLIEKYPAARIVAMTPMQRAGCQSPNPVTGKVLLDYVEAIQSIAGDYSLPVVDMYREAGICVDIPAQRELFCPDGVHPSDAGNARLAQRLYGFLQTL